MPFNDVYTCRIVTLARGCYMLNTFHFAAKGLLTDAGGVVDEIVANIVPMLKTVTSAYTQFTEVNATIVSNPLQDNFAVLLENEFGGVAATSNDPRLGVWIQLRSDFTNAPYGTGGICYGAPPHNWSMDAPKVHPLCIEAWKEMRTYMFNFYRHDRSNRQLEWGIFSRANYSRYPEQRNTWWFPITHMHIRPVFVTRRTRRPRGGV